METAFGTECLQRQLLLKPEVTGRACSVRAPQSPRWWPWRECCKTAVRERAGPSTQLVRCSVLPFIKPFNSSLVLGVWKDRCQEKLFKSHDVEAHYNVKFRDLLYVPNISVLERHLKGLQDGTIHHSIHIAWVLANKPTVVHM